MAQKNWMSFFGPFCETQISTNLEPNFSQEIHSNPMGKLEKFDEFLSTRKAADKLQVFPPKVF